MSFQVRMFWDGYEPHPAFADLEQAKSYAKGLLAQLPEDAHVETEVSIIDASGLEVFNFSLAAWRFQMLVTGDGA
jgi:hypothetical protein